MCLVLEVTFLFFFFAGLSLFSAYRRINISFDAMVTGRAESLPFDSGTSLLMPTFAAIQMPSTGPCLPYFPLLCSPLVGGEVRFPVLSLGSHSLKPLLEIISLWRLHSLAHTPHPQDRCAGGCLSPQECLPVALSTYLLLVTWCFVFSLVLAAGPLHDAFTGFGVLRGSLFLWTGQRKIVV